jgi:3-phenylpropionate/cinnamic acid dioxygenase small subunit
MSADDKLAVAETLYRYAAGVDTRDWSLYRAQFAERVRVDFSSYDSGLPITELAADDWVAGVQSLFSGLHATQHMMTNPLVEVAGDAARVRMYMQATHVLDPNDPASIYTVGGYYDDDLVRHGERWIFTGVKLTVLWRIGDPSIMQTARAGGR